jgi:hypothetical protein
LYAYDIIATARHEILLSIRILEGAMARFEENRGAKAIAAKISDSPSGLSV